MMDILSDHFRELTTSAKNVEQLKKLVLQLAVQGKLTGEWRKQNSDVEPASVLLERIQDEKKRLIKEKKIKRQKPLPEITDAEKPFELPEGWAWCQLDDISRILMGQSPKSNSYNETGVGIPLINGPVEFGGMGAFDKTVKKKYTTAPTKYCEEGDLLICVRGSTTGRTNIAAFDACIGRGVASIRPLNYDKFIHFYILFSKEKIFALGKGSTFPNVSQDHLRLLIIPLPPLPEQKAIVEKVESLFAKIDRLHQLAQKKAETRQNAAKAIFGRINNAATEEDFQTSWQLLHNNFAQVSQTAESVKELRQSILQLAVQGRLTAKWRKQNPDVEPASVLLERIQDEKKRLIKEKKIKRQKPLPEITDAEKPFELPMGWAWCRLEKIGLFERGKSKHRPRGDKKLFQEGKYPFVQTGDVARSKHTNFQITTCSNYYNEFGLKQSKIWPAGTLCITIAANIAETGQLIFDACFPDSVVGFVSVIENFSPEYIRYFIERTKEDIQKFAPATSQKNINLGIINKLSFPLPPLPEQKAIVEKVNRLMSWCDELENKAEAREALHEKTMQAVVQQLGRLG